MSMTKKQTRGSSPVEGERPVHSPDNSTSMLPRARDVSANPATILLVEDEIALRGLMRRILERSGYRVLEAEHGAAALARCATYVGAIDLVVSDIVMPTMGGREMAERLRALRPNSRLLFVSGFTGRRSQCAEGSSSPDSAYLQKPFSPASLVAKIGEMLREPAIEVGDRGASALEVSALQQSSGNRGRNLRAVVRSLQNAKPNLGRPLGGQARPTGSRGDRSYLCAAAVLTGVV